MIKEQGQVVAVEHDGVWIETLRQSACSSCAGKSGCGQHLVEQYRSARHDPSLSYIKVVSSRVLHKGDQVVLGVTESALLKASFLIYLAPLLLMMTGMWLLSLVGAADWLLFLAAALLLFGGFVVVRVISKRSADMCRVEVVSVLPPESVFSSINDQKQE